MRTLSVPKPSNKERRPQGRQRDETANFQLIVQFVRGDTISIKFCADPEEPEMKFTVNIATAILFFMLSGAATSAAAAPSALSDPSPISIGAQYTIRSEILDQTRNITVYLPLSYEASDKNYPVLYLVDGGAAQDYHPITGLASLAGLTGMMREFIVVGVETVNRRYELTSPSSRAY